MSREGLIEYIAALLAQHATGPFPGPRAEGEFTGELWHHTATGLRVLAPDGTLFYLAVLPVEAFEVLPE